MVGPRGEIWAFLGPKTRFSNTRFDHKLEPHAQTFLKTSQTHPLVVPRCALARIGVSLERGKRPLLFFALVGRGPPP